ncbi:hypothetical protein LWI29_022158 [Acer saccharum]|uniref:Uncharacterized protein n=1 Tax=Acer saccharum TaxID=4024 RepID=A0AA39VR59_ACESA|nr:hypothetical protein LWI29_022158 [Acer saccharum]
MLKTLNNEHNCLAVAKNKEVTSSWIGKRFEALIKENPQMNIQVLHSVVLRACGVSVPDHTFIGLKGVHGHALAVFKKETWKIIYSYGRNSKNEVHITCVDVDGEQTLLFLFPLSFPLTEG